MGEVVLQLTIASHHGTQDLADDPGKTIERESDTLIGLVRDLAERSFDDGDVTAQSAAAGGKIIQSAGSSMRGHSTHPLQGPRD